MKYKINEETYTKLVKLGYNNESRNIFDILVWLFEEKQITISTPRVEKMFNKGWGYQIELYYHDKHYPCTYGNIADTPFEALNFGIERFADKPIDKTDLSNVKWKNLLKEKE